MPNQRDSGFFTTPSFFPGHTDFGVETESIQRMSTANWGARNGQDEGQQMNAPNLVRGASISPMSITNRFLPHRRADHDALATPTSVTNYL